MFGMNELMSKFNLRSYSPHRSFCRYWMRLLMDVTAITLRFRLKSWIKSRNSSSFPLSRITNFTFKVLEAEYAGMMCSLRLTLYLPLLTQTGYTLIIGNGGGSTRAVMSPYSQFPWCPRSPRWCDNIFRQLIYKCLYAWM